MLRRRLDSWPWRARGRAGIYRRAREPKQLWTVPEAHHTGAIEARPGEYERRVVSFFDRSLRG